MDQEISVSELIEWLNAIEDKTKSVGVYKEGRYVVIDRIDEDEEGVYAVCK